MPRVADISLAVDAIRSFLSVVGKISPKRSNEKLVLAKGDGRSNTMQVGEFSERSKGSGGVTRGVGKRQNLAIAAQKKVCLGVLCADELAEQQ